LKRDSCRNKKAVAIYVYMYVYISIYAYKIQLYIYDEAKHTTLGVNKKVVVVVVQPWRRAK
jgi:hypothetical protein